MRTVLFIFSCTLLSVLSACAQGETRFYAEANTAEVAVGSAIKISFILENGKNAGRFTPPDWEAAGFMLLSNSQSSSISIINGQKTASATYNYTVSPMEPGNLIIPSVSLKNGEAELRTEPINIQASPNADGINPAHPKYSPASPQSEPKQKIKTIKM